MNSKMKKLTTLGLVAMMAVGLFSMVSCGDKEETTTDLTGWDYIADKGVLTVGLDDTFAPMGFRDLDGNLVGFDIDLANAVGEALGVKVEFQPISWDAKEMELSSKKIDCIWNGMSVTKKRKEAFALTNLYLNNCNVVLTMDKNVKVAKEEDLTKYKIGTQVDSSALNVMKTSKLWDTYAENVSEYPTFDEAIMDLQAGRLDCIVVDQVLGEYKNTMMKDKNKLTTCEFNFGDDFYAIGCRKADTDVATKITEGIQAVIDNGKGEEISNKWFGKNIVMCKPVV